MSIVLKCLLPAFSLISMEFARTFLIDNVICLFPYLEFLSSRRRSVLTAFDTPSSLASQHHSPPTCL